MQPTKAGRAPNKMVRCALFYQAFSTFSFLFNVAALFVVFVVVFTRILCFVQIGSIFITVGFTCFNFLKSRVDRIVCTGMNNGYLLKIYYESYWRATERKEKWLNITMHKKNKKGGKFIYFFFISRLPIDIYIGLEPLEMDINRLCTSINDACKMTHENLYIIQF